MYAGDEQMVIQEGQTAPDFTWQDVHGERVRLEDYRGGPLLLSFYRYASCPLCNMHVHDLLKVYPELDAAGLKVVAFFQSSAEVIARNVGRQDAPFPILADPDKTIYTKYGVTTSAAGLLRGAARMGRVVSAMQAGFMPGDIDGDLSLIPADFLIGPDLIVRRAYYGRDVGDHMPLADVAAFARSWRSTP
jgi:thioredoxin-dependent peroxiredoxin